MKKRILLFIVEGQTDKTSLEVVLSKIFSSSAVKFQIVHGDVLTRDYVSSEKIVNAVGDQVKSFINRSSYKKSDVCKVVHLIDMDGAFIPDDAVVKPDSQNSKVDKDTLYYAREQIITSNPESIIDRNQRKRDNINKLISISKVLGSIPYSVYYFSLNLEDVLHGKTNLSSWEKVAYADEFLLKYGNDPNAFIQLMKESDFTVSGNYHDSWQFIKEGTRSLGRYSNFGLELPEINPLASPDT